MGKKFFSGWELWQQMTFVLACGIVATIFLGLCKLKYDHHRIRKYTKVEKGKQIETPEMLEAQPVQSRDDEVPFGIRAIESGIEVDGVWISRSNTPVGSSRSSMHEIKLPLSTSSSQLELPKAVHGSSSRSSSRAPSSAFDRAVSAERLPTNDSRSSSPGRKNSDPFRGRPPVASSSRYSTSNLTRNSTALHALEGQDPGPSYGRYDYNSAQASSSNSRKSSRTSDESDYMNLPESRPYEPAYINPRHVSQAPVDPRSDLDLLQSHRLSHVAETGQLTPRVRRPGNSGEWASVADNMRSPEEISTVNGVNYFVPRQKTPSPPLAPIDSLPEEPPVLSTPMYTQDSHAANQARQAVPLLETYTPQAKRLPLTYQPRGPQHEYEEEPATYAPVSTTQNQRESHVIRKVNSGFEILRPGTFPEPPSPEEGKPEKRQSKRLQKKRRSSTASSRTSHFIEQV